MPKDILRLVASDERLDHQIVNTFAAVGSSDVNWTEKLWTSLSARDGSLQVDFGVGKYPNRNVLDGFAGVARGRSQWTVRGSRELLPDLDTTGVGPLRYEVVEPLSQVRVVLEPNDIVPSVRFDLVFTGLLPPFFEDRDVVFKGLRMASDVIRYHQAGTVRGVVEVDGERTEVTDDAWFGSRDHSWGIRENVGAPAPDLQPMDTYWGTRYHFQWLTSHLRRPDGTYYEVQYYFRENETGLTFQSGHVNEADGTQRAIAALTPDVRYDPVDGGFAGGEVRLRLDDGRQHLIHLEPLSDTGFHLQPANYFPWKNGRHGTWRGPLHLDGEHFPDTTRPPDPAPPEAWQLRDRPVRIHDGDAHGYGILESLSVGP